MITSKDIKQWADSVESWTHFPELIERLIKESAIKTSSIKVLYGESGKYSGPDVILRNDKKTEYLPYGLSIWESGCDLKFKDKATRDFKKFKTSKNYNFKTTTFIFVTPRVWEENKGRITKNKWLSERKKICKKIIIYDAVDLELWLKYAPTTSLWFAQLIKKYPTTNILSAELFWNEWIVNSKIKFTSSLVLAGRDKEYDKLKKWVEGAPSPFLLKSLTKEEATAFICACINRFDNNKNLLTRTLIVSRKEELRSVINSNTGHIIITDFDDVSLVNSAIEKNNHIIIVASPDGTYTNVDIELEVLGREELVKELIHAGLSENNAIKYSKESGRSLSVLRRLLIKNSNQPLWAKVENSSELIPILLIQRWDDSNEHDRKIIEQVFGMEYSKCSEVLVKYKNITDPPLINIGNLWRLTSPLDAWLILSNFLTSTNIERLRKIATEVICEPDPEFDLNEDDRYKASFLGKVRQYSSWLREGILQTLTLLSIYGTRGKEIEKNKGIVSQIIHSFLDNATELRWFTLSNILPQIAEASPESFLSSVEKSLNEPNPNIKVLFREGEDKLFSRCNFAGLLWALELLAWDAKYLPRVTLILASLIKYYEKGNWANTPLSTLRGIYLVWMPQTCAKIEKRMSSLDILIRKDSDTAIRLLFKLLPSNHEIGHPSYKPRWRMFGELSEQRITYPEMFKAYSEILDRILVLVTTRESYIPKLIPYYDNFKTQEDRDKIYNFVEKFIDSNPVNKNEVWESLRNYISQHTKFSKAEWALPKQEVEKLQKLLDKINIQDFSEKSKWLFDDYYPFVSDEELDYKELENKVDEQRVLAITEIYQHKGITEVYKMIHKVKFPFFLGWALANLEITKNEEEKILNLLIKSENEINFARGYLWYKERNAGNDWLRYIIKGFIREKTEKEIVVTFLINLRHSKDTWNLVKEFDKEIQNSFWEKCNSLIGDYSREDKKYFYENILKVKRYNIAVDSISMYPENVESKFIVEALTNLPSQEKKEHTIDAHRITTLFKELDKRNYDDENKLVQLEFLYLNLLKDNVWGRPPRLLYKKIRNDFNFFIELIRMVYKPKNEELEKEETKDLTEEIIQNRANNVFSLLYAWKKFGFTLKENSSEFISDWIKNTLELGEKYYRIDIINNYIGEILAGTYLNNENSLLIVGELFEKFYSQKLESGFYTGIINSRGTTMRSPFDGGEQERSLAAHYEKISEELQFNFPQFSKAFLKLSESYKFEAEREDISAKQDESDY